MFKRAKRMQKKRGSKFKKFFYALLCVMMFGVGVNQASAIMIPVTDQSLIWIVQTEDPWVWPTPPAASVIQRYNH